MLLLSTSKNLEANNFHDTIYNRLNTVTAKEWAIQVKPFLR